MSFKRNIIANYIFQIFITTIGIGITLKSTAPIPLNKYAKF